LAVFYSPPTLEDKFPTFIAQFHPQASGFLFITSYDPQGYGGVKVVCIQEGTEIFAGDPMAFWATKCTSNPSI
jgi:hypothetical protein